MEPVALPRIASAGQDFQGLERDMHDDGEIDLRCPQIVADNAAKGLRLCKQFGRGGTEIGVARATELKNREKLAPSNIRRMVSYFARHEVDKRGKNYGNEDNPSAGHIAWLLWGGDEGRAWVLELKKKIGNAPDI
jgi:hypothetical protein